MYRNLKQILKLKLKTYQGKDKTVQTPHIHSNTILEVLARAIRQLKKIKRKQRGKGRSQSIAI